MTNFHTIETPKGAPGAIAMIRVVHPDPSAIGLANPTLNGIKLAKIFDIDEGVITRWDPDSIVLMPHGGMAIVRMISAALEEKGLPHCEHQSVFPEAESEIETKMLECISQASSPLAVNLLLDQPEKWKSVGVHTLNDAESYRDVCDGVARSRLLDPPIVAAVGRANIGKSTLINALAGKHVAIVADLAGTTRDHVGVLVDLGGLVVRWIDTPGIDERVGDDEEIDIAVREVSQAQLVVHCIDSQDEVGELDQRLKRAIDPDALCIRVGTRSDMGDPKKLLEVPIDVRVSVLDDTMDSTQFDGAQSLVSMIRDRLVPQSVLDDTRPWRFWTSIRS